MEEVLSIRNPEHLNNYPGLSELRDATIYAYDKVDKSDGVGAVATARDIVEEFIENRHEPFYELSTNQDFTFVELKSFFKEQGLLPVNEDNKDRAIETLTHHLTSSSKCYEYCHYIIEYLESLPDFQGQIYKVTGHVGRYFHNHVGVIINVGEDWYFTSPANIFNLDLTTPVFRGEEYDRSVNVLHSKSYANLVEKAEELEGIIFPPLQDLPFSNKKLQRV